MAKKQQEESKLNDLREILLDLVYEHSKDDFDTVNEVIELSKESIDDLIERLVWILDDYQSSSKNDDNDSFEL